MAMVVDKGYIETLNAVPEERHILISQHELPRAVNSKEPSVHQP